jgi:hypothetical protein
MNIAQALKVRNRIKGRIAKLQNDIYTYNTYVEGQEPEFQSDVLLKELQEEWAYLIDIKTKIAHANNGIQHKLVMLAEAKAELMFWNRFYNTGPAVVTSSSYESTTKTYNTITSKIVSSETDRVQKLIESLQDEIDIYNGVTLI